MNSTHRIIIWIVFILENHRESILVTESFVIKNQLPENLKQEELCPLGPQIVYFSFYRLTGKSQIEKLKQIGS